MASDERKPEKMIKDIIAFLEKEREVFGAFSLPDGFEEASSKAEESHPSQEDAPSQPVSHREDGAEGDSISSRLDQCRTLMELEELCRQTDQLRTDLENTNLVFGVGNPDADLMLIGEAPGEKEDRLGEPFVGAAGKLLDKIMASIDFSREEIYIANILKHRPPGNRNPTQEERERSLPFLLKQIDLIRPKLILCLGKISAQTLLNSNKTLGKMRGRFHPFREHYELLATYHPAALLRHESWKRPTWEDVKKLRRRYDELGCKP